MNKKMIFKNDAEQLRMLKSTYKPFEYSTNISKNNEINVVHNTVFKIEAEGVYLDGKPYHIAKVLAASNTAGSIATTRKKSEAQFKMILTALKSRKASGIIVQQVYSRTMRKSIKLFEVILDKGKVVSTFKYKK